MTDRVYNKIHIIITTYNIKKIAVYYNATYATESGRSLATCKVEKELVLAIQALSTY